jgi:hypothetical protein
VLKTMVVVSAFPALAPALALIRWNLPYKQHPLLRYPAVGLEDVEAGAGGHAPASRIRAAPRVSVR